MSRPERPPRGFTLLETLVAFIIAAAAAVALFEAFGTGLRASSVADHTLEAWQRARSRLAAQSISPQPGDTAGDDGGGFAWRASIRPLQQAPMIESQDQRELRLYTVAITISWRLDGGERHVRLVSDRLSVAGPVGP